MLVGNHAGIQSGMQSLCAAGALCSPEGLCIIELLAAGWPLPDFPGALVLQATDALIQNLIQILRLWDGWVHICLPKHQKVL